MGGERAQRDKKTVGEEDPFYSPHQIEPLPVLDALKRYYRSKERYYCLERYYRPKPVSTVSTGAR